MVQRLKRVGALSVAKSFAVLYAALGFFVGCIIALISMLAPSFMGSIGAGGGSFMMPMIGGIGSLVVLPILYAVFGFIGGLIGGWLYNMVARVTGGIEFELE